MERISNEFASIGTLENKRIPTGKSVGKTTEGDFRSTLAKSVADGELKFSKHAAKRLDDRHIALSESQNKRLSDGVAKAEEKGINDSLVMVDSLAFIVNVPSQTVVTALDEKEAQDHIYTNIDGAVIA